MFVRHKGVPRYIGFKKDGVISLTQSTEFVIVNFDKTYPNFIKLVTMVVSLSMKSLSLFDSGRVRPAGLNK